MKNDMGTCGTPGEVRFSPLFNDAFLQIFGRKDSAPVTRPFLNAVLRAAGFPEVDDIEISADAASAGGIACRTSRFDILIISDNRIFDVEAQRYYVDVGNKSLFYAARLIAENTPKGGDGSYRNMPQVTIITLLEGRKLFPESPQIITTSTLKWNLGGDMVDTTDRVAFVVVELDKVRERYNGGMEEVLADESLAWLYVLAGGYQDEREVEGIMGAFPTIEEFATRYGIAIGDPRLKRSYDNYVANTLERNTIIEEAREEGFVSGHEEAARLIAGRLRELGVDEALIQKAVE